MTTFAYRSDELLETATALLPSTIELRRKIHRHPEQGLQLPKTQAAVLEAIADLPLEVTKGRALTSVVADVVGGRGDGPTILLRGDMDALPMPEDTGVEFRSEVEGAMHACGHDSHTAMLASAARLLCDRRDEFAGRVRFMFQPGEEGYHGARYMIDEGVIDGVEAVFALHVTPNGPNGVVFTKGGAIMAAANVLRITVKGQGGHASSPFLGNDPMPVAAEIVTALQTFVTRRIHTFDPVVITIARISGGTTNNVIPETVELEGTLRSVSEGSRKKALDGIERIVQHIAAAHEMEASFENVPGYPVVLNNQKFADFTRSVAARALGDDNVFELPTPMMGAEDFAYLLNERPGAFAFLGVCPPGESPAHAPGCHSNRMMIDESAMRNGIAMYSAMALDYLNGGFVE